MSEILSKEIQLTGAQVQDLDDTPVVLLDGTDDVGNDKIVDLVTALVYFSAGTAFVAEVVANGMDDLLIGRNETAGSQVMGQLNGTGKLDQATLQRHFIRPFRNETNDSSWEILPGESLKLWTATDGFTAGRAGRVVVYYRLLDAAN